MLTYILTRSIGLSFQILNLFLGGLQRFPDLHVLKENGRGLPWTPVIFLLTLNPTVDSEVWRGEKRGHRDTVDKETALCGALASPHWLMLELSEHQLKFIPCFYMV